MTTAKTIQQVHWQTLLRSRGEPVTYIVSEEYSIEDLMIVVTRPVESTVQIDQAIVLDNSQWDALIDPDTLVDADGNRIEPQQGHLIVRADGTRLRVEPTNGGRKCWRWSEALETWRRVHTVSEGS